MNSQNLYESKTKGQYTTVIDFQFQQFPSPTNPQKTGSESNVDCSLLVGSGEGKSPRIGICMNCTCFGYHTTF